MSSRRDAHDDDDDMHKSIYLLCVCQSTVRASASVFGPCPFEKVSKRCDVTYRENHAIEESPFYLAAHMSKSYTTKQKQTVL